ncbi:hypothetical protein [Frigoribacterium sp. MCBA15_019]|uniref:hypothetical protein n=1 Tax=Frigoribacterium sp. MCBA15_019 TaxID=1898745 RepID=UPI0008DCECF7|nr:hypothetical protein [Frigoribacterium sp. MCBA15_019]OII23934.1 hypothetical protein BIV04_07780 [Frigoribacterium sp. MCBA15_019]
MTTDLQALRLSVATHLAPSVEESFQGERHTWRLFGRATQVSLEVELLRGKHLLITLAGALVIESDSGLDDLNDLFRQFDRDEAFVVLSSTRWGRLFWWIEIGDQQVVEGQYAGWFWRSRGARTQERSVLCEDGDYL